MAQIGTTMIRMTPNCPYRYGGAHDLYTPLGD